MSTTPRRILRLLSLIALAHLAAPAAPQAGDWPQILGPARDGVAVDEKLLDRWPADGPKKLWSRPVGQGYAGPAIVGSQVFLFHRIDGQERLEAFDAATGKTLWKADFPAAYRGGIDPDVGPRCVPLVHEGSVYVYGAAGALHAVDAKTGKPRWSRELLTDYQGDEGYFGAGSTPVVAGDRLLVNVGGRPNAGLVAVDKNTGRTLWKATSEDASYSSPVVAKLQDRSTVVFITRLNCLGVDPTDGKVLFQTPFGKRGPTVNAATPLVLGDRLFLSASYGVGARLLEIRAGGTADVWGDDDTLSSQYSTAVHLDGMLYGVHGREDVGTGELRCVRAADGKIAWSEREFGVAHLIRSGDRLLALRVDGRLDLIAADPRKFERLASAALSTDSTRALPALAHGRLVLRSNIRGGEGALSAFEVGGK